MGISDIFNRKKTNEEINFQEKKIEEIKIISFLSVNELKYDVHREDVWKKFGRPQKSFFKGDNNVESDVYENFFVYYDEDYNFIAIEIFGNINIYYDDYKLPKKYSEILKYFKAKYNDIEEDGNGFITRKGSVGVYIENDEDIVDAILFAKKDYYK